MAVKINYKNIPMVALRAKVIFPGTGTYLDIGRSKTIEAIGRAFENNQPVLFVTQKDYDIDDPGVEDLYSVGVIGEIDQFVNKTDSDIMRVYVKGIARAEISSVVKEEPCFICNARVVKDKKADNTDKAVIDGAIRALKGIFSEYIKANHLDISRKIAEAFFAHDPSEIADLIANEIYLEYQQKQIILEESDPIVRIEKLYRILHNEVNILRARAIIEEKVDYEMEKNQRDYYLREQVKVILGELGEGEDVVSEAQAYKEKISNLDCSKQVRSILLKECNKLAKMPNGSVDSSVIRSYIDTALTLPFGNYSVDVYDLNEAKKILDDDHFGLEKVKERFIEMLAVRARTNCTKGNIICLVGPPGVGKTSIVRSVAKAMNRKYVRLSLGGVSDEAEIRGHRKTYIGAMPGRIAKALIQAKTFNPIILLDEIDKLGKNFRGDPASAMLEVLDPEQNYSFRDNYMEFPVDLSNVLFVTTANDPTTIPKPLYDRMEIIELTSYSPEEKFMIARNHLVKKQMKLHGLDGNNIRFTDEAIKFIIDCYTREAGVRKLEQVISNICRKSVVALEIGMGKRITVTIPKVKEFLGPEKFSKELIDKNDLIGVVNGLAWTSVGGELLQVECIVMDGDGKLELTGSLGDVMKESARAAYSYIKSVADEYGIDKASFTDKNIHIHVPQGAVPKDGPSAGVTIATALLSVLADKKVKCSVAMTGEVTLTGRVLRIGGLKEKSMAAYKVGVKKIIIPEDNLGDLWEIDDVVKNNVEFVGVKHLRDVFRHSIAESLITKNKSNVKFEPHDIIIRNRREADEIR